MRRFRRSNCRSAAAAALVGLLVWSCTATPPPVEQTVDPLAEALGLFEEREYAAAGAAYREWIENNGDGPGADHALFHQALAYLSAPADGKDIRIALGLLRRVVNEFPDSPYEPSATIILGWRAEIHKLRVRLEEIDQLRAELADVDELRAQLEELDQLRKQLEELDRLRAQLEELDQLRAQLEELKRIDLSEPEDEDR